MKELFRRFGEGRKKWSFSGEELSESTEELFNPARGWYQIHSFQAEREPDFHELEWCIDRRDALTMVLIDIGYYRDRDLDREGLDRIRRILSFFAGHGYDMIVRFVYDHEGKAMEREPFFFQQVMSHLQQLCGILEEFSEWIFVFQGMLVGSWGEMHSSRFLSQDKLSRMAEVLRRRRDGKPYLAVRRPVYWRMLHQDMKCCDGMGLFDDGMFGSKSNLGTFGTEERACAPWDSPWSREDELAFEKELCRYVPNGGEAVFDEEFQKQLTPGGVLSDLRQMQITYLNKVFDARQLDIWRQWKYPGPGSWAGKSLFDYVGAHLGYRFLIQRVSVLPKKGSEQQCLIEIEIENTGFGGFYQEAEVYLECVGEGDICLRTDLECHMKGWCSGEKRLLSCTADIRDCRIFLTARRQKDGSCIRFANASDKDGRVALGYLHEK